MRVAPPQSNTFCLSGKSSDRAVALCLKAAASRVWTRVSPLPACVPHSRVFDCPTPLLIARSYAVVYLHREGCVFPYARHLSKATGSRCIDGNLLGRISDAGSGAARGDCVRVHRDDNKGTFCGEVEERRRR